MRPIKSLTTLFIALPACLLVSGTLPASRAAAQTPATQSQFAESGPSTTIDRTQWRKLHIGMSKDDVKKLLGDPGKVSASKYYELWYYGAGGVTFDKKGHVDAWIEP
jgi:outer membrane protein assembly factor BamE (lipoprotein component of BamABCDE complex)